MYIYTHKMYTHTRTHIYTCKTCTLLWVYHIFYTHIYMMHIHTHIIQVHMYEHKTIRDTHTLCCLLKAFDNFQPHEAIGGHKRDPPSKNQHCFKFHILLNIVPGPKEAAPPCKAMPEWPKCHCGGATSSSSASLASPSASPASSPSASPSASPAPSTFCSSSRLQEQKRCHKLWCCHLPPVRPLYELAARRALTTTTRGLPCPLL